MYDPDISENKEAEGLGSTSGERLHVENFPNLNISAPDVWHFFQFVYFLFHYYCLEKAFSNDRII